MELHGKPLDTAASAIASTLDDLSRKQASCSWARRRSSTTSTGPRQAGALKYKSGWRGSGNQGAGQNQTAWRVTEDREMDPRLATIYDARRFKLLRQR